MIRVVIQEAHASMAANVGGPVEVTLQTIDIEAPELEALLRSPLGTYSHRQVVGVEVLDSTAPSRGSEGGTNG